MIQPLLVQIFNQEIGTSLILDGLNEPAGLDSFTITQKRDREAEGLLYEFTFNLDFVKQGREYLKAVYESQGVDGIIAINIYGYDPNEYKFNIVEYQGQLKLDNYNIDEVKVSTNVEPIGFQRKFLNLQKRNVNMESGVSRLGAGIGVANSIDLPMKPKTIKKKAILQGSDEYVESGLIGGLPSGFNVITRVGDSFSESDFDQTFLGVDFFQSPSDINETPIDTKNFIQKITEAGTYTFDFSDFIFDILIGTGNSDIDAVNFRCSFAIEKKGGQIENAQFLYDQTFGRNDFDVRDTNPPEGSIRYEKFNQSLNQTELTYDLEVGDNVYLWFRYGIDFELSGTSDRNVGYRFRADTFKFEYTANTIFPETKSKTYLIYEFMEHIFQFLTDQPDCFRSDFFGRTDSTPAYPVDGPGSLIGITNGRSLRQLENQNLFSNWEDTFQSFNSLYCLGWDFETLEDGNQVIRVEPKSYFYRKGVTAFEFPAITDISKFAEIKLLFSNVKFGYPKIESINQVNGIDEFNTQREISSPLINITNELDLTSVFRASGFEIESQRRLLNSTEDSKLDDENFLIALKRNGSEFEVEQGIDFEFVNNVFDPDTAYNVRISPARNIRFWGDWLASNVIRSNDKVFKFSFGDYNYQMESKKVSEPNSIKEDSNFDLTEYEALFYPDKYEWTSEFGLNESRIIDSNRYGVVKGVDYDGNEIEGFIMKQERTLSERKGEFVILRVFRQG